MARRPTVYLDTTIISAYWYEGGDVLAVGRRLLTRQWWEQESRNFTLLVSAVTEDELGAGKFPRQRECLGMAGRLRHLPVTRAVHELAGALLASRVVPATKAGDALQMAMAAAHGVDYLLTWNYAHLANPVAQEKLAAVCRKRERVAPLLVSPENIPRVSLGQSIRRKLR